MLWTAQQRNTQRIWRQVWIAVIEQYTRRRHNQRRILNGAIAIGSRYGGLVNFAHCDLEDFKIVQGWQAIIGHGHRNRIHTRPIGLGRGPGESAAGRVDGWANQCTCIQAEGE